MAKKRRPKKTDGITRLTPSRPVSRYLEETPEFKRIKAESEAKRKVWEEDQIEIVRRNSVNAGDQHARCDYCGQQYLITVDTLGVGCAVCTDLIKKFPFGAKFILNAVVSRLTALETLRRIDEQSIISSQDKLEDLRSLVLRLAQPQPEPTRKKARR